MITQTIYIESDCLIPYNNLALEEYLLLNTKKGQCILYLWQNRNTVVIGRNQNCWRECNTVKLKEDDGYVVRRLSGGGAVYHDLGNLNFTFLVKAEDYNLQKQLEVIKRAVNKLGIQAEQSGRNDITVDNRKFSGNAFYKTGDVCYHHGTIMINVDKSKLTRYLNVSQEKLKSKGINSVKSRVVNLSDFCEELSIPLMKQKLMEAFAELYGITPEVLSTENLDAVQMEQLTEKYSSWNWIYGRKLSFEYEIGTRFFWGDFTLQFSVNHGIICSAVVYSDAMEQDIIAGMDDILTGCRFHKEEICQAILRKKGSNEIILNIIDFIKNQESF